MTDEQLYNTLKHLCDASQVLAERVRVIDCNCPLCIEARIAQGQVKLALINARKALRSLK